MFINSDFEANAEKFIGRENLEKRSWFIVSDVRFGSAAAKKLHQHSLKFGFRPEAVFDK